MNIPTVTSEDLLDFHARHFSSHMLENFPTKVAHISEAPQETQLESDGAFHAQVKHDNGYSWDDVVEEDDLGYYPDGVKRTLTDGQIKMFRHSEEEAIRREKRRQDEAKAQTLLDEIGELEEEVANDKEDEIKRIVSVENIV